MCLLSSPQGGPQADWAPVQVPGGTAEARIAGKLRLLQRLVDGAPKQLAGAAGDAPAAAQAALIPNPHDEGVGLPPAYKAWDSLGQRGAKLLLAGEALERFDARRGAMLESLRLMLDALDAGLPQEQAAVIGNKPYQVLP